MSVHLPGTQGYCLYFWNTPEFSPFHHRFSRHPGPTLPHLSPECLQEPLQWYHCSCQPAAHPPCSGRSDPVGPHPLLHSKLSCGSCFATGNSLALLMTMNIPCDAPCHGAKLHGMQPVSALISAQPSPTLPPLLLHSRVTGLSRGATCLPHTFAPAVSSAQHTLPSHVDVASSSTFFRSLFKSHFLSLSWSSYIKYIKFQNTENFVSIFPVIFAS